MTTFIFNSAQLQDLESGTFYATLVASVPLPQYTSWQQLDKLPECVPVILQGKTLTATEVKFNDFVFPIAAYSSQAVGYVVTKNDIPIAFNGYQNAVGDDVVIPAGEYRQPESGVVIKRSPAYKYHSGDIGALNPGAATPFGSIYLAGIRNNAANGFANPVDGIRMQARRSSDGASLNGLYDRSSGNDGATNHILDLKNNKIRVGKIVIYTAVTLGFASAQVFGSNQVAPSYNDAASWTPITAVTNITPNPNWTILDSLDKMTFWSYLKFYVPTNNIGGFSIIEFMSSTFQSKTLNMVP